MTEAEVYGSLTTMFRDFFDDPTIVLRPETAARDIEGWDSAKMVSIILGVEETFGFEMSSSEIDGLRCIADFVAVILSRQPGSRSPPAA
jgi:acyl carrier protein